MMEVNAFWFGFLIAIVVLMVVTIILALLGGRNNSGPGDINISPEEYKAALEKMTGKKMRVYRDRNGYLVGEAIEDPDDDEAE